jgi:putative transposase
MAAGQDVVRKPTLLCPFLQESLHNLTKAVDEDRLFEAYERMRGIEEEAISKTALERRKRQRRENAAHKIVVLPKPSGESTPLHLPFGEAQPFEEMEEMP